jgi:hypothetical protein
MSHLRSTLVVLVSLSAACDRATILQPESGRAAATAARTAVASSVSLGVADVEQLYRAVNDPHNAGAAIVLAPGIYVLSARDANGAARPNGGRLELQPDMSLTGVANDRSAVVIDMSTLPAASFTVTLGKTSGIRVGRGSNSVEWLTILGNPNSGAGVETDLADLQPADVTIAHVLAHGSIRGIDVRNTGDAMAGRRIVARIDDNEFYGGTEGIRVLNSGGVAGGQIDATMSGNRVHHNVNGCIIEHNRASAGTIRVRSSGDRFEHNALGCLIGGGLVAGPAAGVANSNSTVFEAYGDAFVDNTLDVPSIDYGGVLVLGAETPTVANRASHNSVTTAFWGTKVSGNQNVDFQAYGARPVAVPAGTSGTDNHAIVELHGVSRQIGVDAVNSLPQDAGGTNTVTVIR